MKESTITGIAGWIFLVLPYPAKLWLDMPLDSRTTTLGALMCILASMILRHVERK